ncbi:MAG: NosD domain-containing protein [Caldilineaceae bacterium]
MLRNAGAAYLFASNSVEITVNTAADPGDGVCTLADCTLREALALANAQPGENTIVFHIPGQGPHTIQPIGDLPAIVDPLIIDGYTQPGAQPNTNPLSAPMNTVIMIEIDGSRANRGFDFTGNSWNSVVRGLAINRFRATAISDSRRIAVEGNFIGTDPSGTQAVGNGTGFDSGGGIGGTTPRIGGTTPAARNLIAGNGAGIVVGALSFATVEGNFIGTDRSGTQALGNGVGVIASNCVGCELGRITLQNNLISGNATGARSLYTCCSIAGNLFGTDRTGQLPLPNVGDGLIVSSFDMNVSGNTFAYNGGNGIRVVDSSGPNMVRLGRNRIFANGAAGIVVTGDRAFAHLQQNLIYDNGTLGIDLGNDGVTFNEIGDGDSGPNLRQNFPELRVVGSDGTSSVINGMINGGPNRTLTLEFYANRQCDGSGYGEGEFFWQPKL